MNRNKLMLVLAAVAAVAVIAGGLLLGVQPQLAQASADHAQRAQIDKTNDANRAELARLQAAQQELPASRRELAALRASIPSSPATASFIRDVYSVATASSVTVTNIATGDPVSYVPPTSADAGASAPASTASPAPSSTPAPTGSASPVTPHAPAAVTDPQITSSNFSTLQMSITVSGSYDQALAFTSGMQRGKRLFLVNSITSGGGSGRADGGEAELPTWALTGFIYVLSDPSTAAPTNG